MNRPTESASALTDTDLWNGGFLEAAIVLGPRDDPDADARLVSALNAVWSTDVTFGPYLDRFGFGPDSTPLTSIDPGTIDLVSPGHLYGWIKLPSDEWSVGGTCAIREDGFGGQALDWLDVYLPLGALAHQNERVGAYAFEHLEECSDWLAPISALLGQIGCAVLNAIDGRMAFIGFEVSGTSEADSWTGAVPSERSVGYVSDGDSGVAEYFPPTEWR